MNPADVARLVAKYGPTVTLRRDPATDVALKARVSGFAPDELVGEIKQGDRRVVIANAEIAAAAWPGPPKIGDRLIVSGKIFTIGAVDTRKLGDEIAGHWLTVKG